MCCQNNFRIAYARLALGTVFEVCTHTHTQTHPKSCTHTHTHDTHSYTRQHRCEGDKCARTAQRSRPATTTQHLISECVWAWVWVRVFVCGWVRASMSECENLSKKTHVRRQAVSRVGPTLGWCVCGWFVGGGCWNLLKIVYGGHSFESSTVETYTYIICAIARHTFAYTIALYAYYRCACLYTHLTSNILARSMCTPALPPPLRDITPLFRSLAVCWFSDWI